MALCLEHLEPLDWGPLGSGYSLTKGLYTVVREDGSASKVQASQVEWWNYHAGSWIQRKDIGDYMHFPGEPWPPEFEP